MVSGRNNGRHHAWLVGPLAALGMIISSIAPAAADDAEVDADATAPVASVTGLYEDFDPDTTPRDPDYRLTGGGYEINRIRSGATVYVSDYVHDKVTNRHKVPDWLVIKSVMYAYAADFAVRNPDYSPYTYRVWEWICNSSGCQRGERNQLMRIVIDWVDGVADHGRLVTAFCKRPGTQECPLWVQTADPYWGPPGPQ
jgi:hypothetical protein